jgi:hypothetical protein
MPDSALHVDQEELFYPSSSHVRQAKVVRIICLAVANNTVIDSDQQRSHLTIDEGFNEVVLLTDLSITCRAHSLSYESSLTYFLLAMESTKLGTWLVNESLRFSHESCLGVMNTNEFFEKCSDRLPLWFVLDRFVSRLTNSRGTTKIRVLGRFRSHPSSRVHLEEQAPLHPDQQTLFESNSLRVMTPSSLWDNWHRIQASVSRRRRRNDLPRTIEVCDGPQIEQGKHQAEQENSIDDGDLASHLRSVHQQYRAGLVSEKDFRKVKASILIRVLRRRSTGRSTSSTISSEEGSASALGFFSMATPDEFRESVR